MTDQVRNEELHVWRIRIQNGMFDPADLCEFAVRLMDALESAEVDLARVKDVGEEYSMKLSNAQIAGLKEVEENGVRPAFAFRMRFTTMQKLMSLELIEFINLTAIGERGLQGLVLTEKGRKALEPRATGGRLT